MPHFSIQSILKVCTEEKICLYLVPCSFRTWLIGIVYDQSVNLIVQSVLVSILLDYIIVLLDLTWIKKVEHSV